MMAALPFVLPLTAPLVHRGAAPELSGQGGGDPLPDFEFVQATGLNTISVSSGGGGYVVGEIIDLAGGTATYGAKARVTSTGAGGAATGVVVHRPGIYQSAPTSPASQGSTSGSGSGATFTVAFNPTAASSCEIPNRYLYNNAALRWNAVAPLTNVGSSGWYGSAAYQGQYNSVEIVCNSDRLDLLILGFTTTCLVTVDGKPLSATDFATGASGYYVLTQKWKTAKERVIKLFGINLAVRAAIVPTGYTISLPSYVRPPLVYFMGDSYTHRTGAASQATTWAMEVCRINGWECLPVGIPGTGLASTGAANVPATRVANDFLQRMQASDAIIIPLGYNDAGGNMATVTSQFSDAIDAIRAARPSIPILAMGPWTPQGETPNLATVKNTVSAAAATKSTGFTDISDVITAANAPLYTGGDNVHPNAAGHIYIGQQVAPRLKAALGL